MRICIYKDGEEVANFYHEDNTVTHEQQIKLAEQRYLGKGYIWDEVRSRQTRAGLKTFAEMTPEEAQEVKQRCLERLNKT